MNVSTIAIRLGGFLLGSAAVTVITNGAVRFINARAVASTYRKIDEVVKQAEQSRNQE